ncbi:unnamed protein product [Discula destructiva]
MASAAVARACDLLEAQFPGRLITKDAGAQYEAERDLPWSQSCWTPSAGYIVLNSAQEVASALSIIKQSGSKFSIRTTGHNPNAGFSSAGETGIVFDLRGIKGKSLDDDGVLHAGAGNVWGDIYPFLEEQGRVPVGGRELGVGLGGFLTSGGYPAMASLFGTGPDNVKGCEVVLADGSIVEANSTTNEDLWRALKGGSSNFGIVTRFDLETHPVVKTQYSIQLYNAADAANINAATIAAQEEMEKDPNANVFTNFNKGFVAVFKMYARQPSEQPPAFKALDALTSSINTPLPKTDGTILSMVQIISQMGHIPTPMIRKIGSLTIRPSQGLYDAINKRWQDMSKTLPEAAVLHYTIQPFSTHAVRAGEQRGGNFFGLKEVPQCWLVITAEWVRGSADDAVVEQAHEDLLRSVEGIAREKGLLLDFICPSFANAGQNVLASFGKENLKKYQEVASKFDPEGLFQRFQNGGLLLRNA